MRREIEALDLRNTADAVTAGMIYEPAAARFIDGHALFDGPDSPLTRVCDAEGVKPTDLARYEARYAAFGATPHVDLTDTASPEQLAALEGRGYVRAYDRVVCTRALDEPPPACRAELVPRAEVDPWADAIAAGFEGAHRGLAARLRHQPSAHLFGVREGSGWVAGGAVRVHQRLALLFCASTRPEHRRQGHQADLVAARLSWARTAGSALAVACASPGSASLRNLRRVGFEPRYVRTTWRLG